MPQSVLNEVIDQLKRFSDEEAAWQPVQKALPALRERVAWLEAQADLIPAPLVAVLFGGTGTGKSTLLNALAGVRIAEVGDRRPTTEEPTVYHPPGISQDLGPAKYVQSGYLDDLVLVDMPDTDSVKTEHCARVLDLLKSADVVLFCGTQQKYKNEQSIALLRPLRNERKVVCIQTRADEDPDIRQDWLAVLEDEGIAVDHCFRVSAARALTHKLDGRPGADEFEFQALEAFVTEKLPPERIGIKERNLEGALKNTLDGLDRELHGKEGELDALLERMDRAETEVARVSLGELQRQMLDAPHVWVVALGDAVSERAFGLVGTLFRLLHWVRMLPARVTGKFSLSGLLRAAAGAAPSAAGNVREEDAFLRKLAQRFAGEHADVNAHLARAGFAIGAFDDWQDDLLAELGARIEEYLEPVQKRLNRCGRVLARWVLPVLEIAWLAPFAFTVGVPIYQYYANLVHHADVVLPEPGFLTRSGSMLAAVILIELVAFAYLVRWSGRLLRARSRRDLAREFRGRGFGFAKQRSQVQQALGRLEQIKTLRTTVDPSSS